MGVDLLEFCTPPVPGQQHKYYGNAHNNFIKLPITLPRNKIQKPVSSSNTLHSIATLGNLNLLKQILPLLPAPQKAANEHHPSTGLTPLHFAASRGHLETVKYLVDDYSATIDAKDREGETALLKAAYNGHFPVVQYLVSKNANIHSKDKDGWTALHNACARGYLPVARLLIQHDARVDVKSKMGHTPLINAASKGYIEIVEYLLDEAHANPLIKNSFGEAAYDVSAAAGESYICDLLYKAGKVWWEMQHTDMYQLLDYHVTVIIIIYENEKSSSMLGMLSKPYFSPNTLGKNGPWSLYPFNEACTKEQVKLPLNAHGNSDWFWLTDWQINYTDPHLDPNSGWQYARSFEDKNWTPVAPASGYGWVRRRKWVRVMKRRMDLLKGNHLGNVMLDEQDDYLSKAEDIVQNSKLDSTISMDAAGEVQQLTIELRALEEAVQVLRAGIKNDGNQYRTHQATTLLTSYTLQINRFNTKIAHLAPAVSTPISPLLQQHNPELARELGFTETNNSNNRTRNTTMAVATAVATTATASTSTTTTNTSITTNAAGGAADLDTNPWSRETAIIVNWQENLMESSSLSQVDLIGHGIEEVEVNTPQREMTAREYTWELDAEVKECRGCNRRFGFLLRRHHCRCCGIIHCDRCSMSRAYLQPSQILQDPRGPFESLDILSSQHQRVCDNCYAKLGGLPPS
ncbi:hypothetical protein G6F56_005654 [Rhizopus delemar]|uniref:FYVE-type domain-containing protein n=1 Tax=Rhizopus stolonifer TaxID=4846 RepID=A0A367KXL1_RHIST|nr:hypothetical protein G6F56_005654 [Rhizopus delemar]RCI06948.1 hypothetical protein CU098_012242 [Rhizopus stolonifer]